MHKVVPEPTMWNGLTIAVGTVYVHQLAGDMTEPAKSGKYGGLRQDQTALRRERKRLNCA